MSQATDDAKEALKNICGIDVDGLARVQFLGQGLNFSDAVPHARKAQEIYQKLSPDVVDTLSDAWAENIQNMVRNTNDIWNRILKFDPQNDPPGDRDGLIQQAQNDADSVFDTLHGLVAYGASVSINMQQLENDLRQIVQQARSDANESKSQTEKLLIEANQIVTNIRDASAEAGLSRQATFFEKASNSHRNQSIGWGIMTGLLAILLAFYAGISVWKPEWFNIFIQDDTQRTDDIQLTLGKILLFAVISYGVFLSARNFMSHIHNTIVNRHRQNALMTFQALVGAAGDEANQDIVLAYAAACIFSPQSTGYTKLDGKSPLLTHLLSD